MGALQKIRDAGFEVTLDGDAFEIEPASKLTQTQRVFLKSNRVEIIDELKAEIVRRDPYDDRRFCRECRSLIGGRCVKQHYRPVDDIPRRCIHFRVI